MDLVKAAKEYRDKYGFSVIPLLNNKRPAIEWMAFQYRRATDEEIESWFKDKNDKMLGIVCGSISGICVIDVDSADGDIAYQRLIPKDFRSPVVRTPRGGYHVYCRHNAEIRNKANVSNGLDIRGEGGYVVAPPSVNGKGGEYKWLIPLHRASLPDIPLGFLSTCGNRYQELPLSEGRSGMFVKGRRDEDLFHVANLLVRGGSTEEVALEVIERLANSCTPPFPSQEVAGKVRSALHRAYTRERNLAQEIKDWIVAYKGIFLSSEMARALQINNKDHLKEMAKILNKLTDEGYIERYGRRSGVFRKIERDYRKMEWLSASIQPIEINYPLGLHNIFVTYAKNVIVVAGVKDSGKTAFFLDFIKRNHTKFKINYFTNEMGDEELSMRIRQHKDIDVKEWSFSAYEMGGAWEDIIEPDCITIVDYIEINNNFWEIGEVIKKMHEKLDKGILLLGLQKAYGQLLGRGKEFSLQRPRLYVTLENGRATIISAKNRLPSGPNVVGWQCHYSIIDGWKIKTETPWHQPQGERT